MQKSTRVAVVGIGTAFPSAPNLDAFQDLIRSGRDVAADLPSDRIPGNLDGLMADEKAAPDKIYSRRGCFLDLNQVKPDFSKLTISEDHLTGMDPMFQVGLYAAQQAYSDAKMASVDHSRISVLIGNIVLPTESTSRMTRDSLGARFIEQALARHAEGGSNDRAENMDAAGLPAALMAQALGLGGGYVTLDAACASSLYALALAAEELKAGRVDAVLTGGLSRPDCLYTQMGFAQLRALSATGVPAPFDARANGLVVGEGAGIFVLKRLDDALAHGDTIHGIIAGHGLSNDMAGALLAPSSEGQLRAMRRAYEHAGWQPEDVDLIECHATGTPLGDQVEFESLQQLWQNNPGRATKPVIGSVKSNVGHLLTAAGAAATAKVLAALRHKELPPTANFQKPPSGIGLNESPFRVLNQSEAWRSDGPRRAAVSAFGFGGINAHILIEEYQEETSQAAADAAEDMPAIAVIAQDAHLGANAHGDAVSAMLRKQQSNDAQQLTKIQVPFGRYRIPPNEIQEMLPQQLLMLNVAYGALKKAGLEQTQNPRRGCFIGIALDPNTANFQLRWFTPEQARRWNHEYNLGLDEQGIQSWVAQLRKALGPALNANRTIGALGGMVASRIARELRFGGPSFTLSAEELSGARALETAVRALQRNEIDVAIAGAVDITSDPRHVRPGVDSAAAFVLKRLEDAHRDGDTVLAVVDQCSFGAAANDQEESQVLYDGASLTHHYGASGALLNLYRAVSDLSDRVLPSNQYWLQNGVDGPRRAVVIHRSANDQSAVTISEDPKSKPVRALLHEAPVHLFPLEADSDAGILTRAKALLASDLDDLAEAARTNWRERRPGTAKAAVLIAESPDQLRTSLQTLIEALENPHQDEAQRGLLHLEREKLLVYNREPLGDKARIAFVFPGSGNHYAGMGRDLALAFPKVFDQLARETTYLRDEFSPESFWADTLPEAIHNQHPKMLSGQVILGVACADVLQSLGISPKACIGYSLGESVAMFATKAWRDRDGMHLRTRDTPLFQSQLAGELTAVKEKWGLSHQESVNWTLGVVNRPAEQVRALTEQQDRVYLLIVNTPGECVIGGDHDAVHAVVKALGCGFVPLQGVTAVHCPVLDPVADAYRALHVFPTYPPEGVTFYSGHHGKAYELNSDSIADSILANARAGVDWPKTINAAYDDGFNVFLEMGPGNSCSRMIDRILEGKPHLAKAFCHAGTHEVTGLARLLAALISERVSLDGDYPLPILEHKQEASDKPMIEVPVGPQIQTPPPPPKAKKAPIEATAPPVAKTATKAPPMPKPTPAPAAHVPNFSGASSTAPAAPAAPNPVMDDSFTRAHEVFLRISQRTNAMMAETIAYQNQLIGQMQNGDVPVMEMPQPTAAPAPTDPSGPRLRPPVSRPNYTGPKPFMDRDACLAYAVDQIGPVLGQNYAAIDGYPTRVRLPDEPLMLVDRIMEVSGEPMKSGRVVTEHDILADAWYLDCNRIPTCIAVEAGQADLFLAGYLGIDFETKGLAVYRLLDAVVTFHRDMPGPGETIRYDIHIDNFFRQGDTWLFRFRFEGTVNGEPLLTMRDGCAGFFSQAELDAGKGIIKTSLQRKAMAGKRPADWRPLVPMQSEAYSEAQINALCNGDLAAAFGPQFASLPLQRPMGLPSGAMKLVDRVTHLEPDGGRFGLGFIRAEADIHPLDWFIVCHFVDDMVMPGTLMYECCLHTLRVYLMRMGWVCEDGEAVAQPVKGVGGRLKCRGQVLETTKVAAYEVTIKEIGYNPEPYVIVDADMYADGKPIVEIEGMSLRLTGLTRERLEQIWSTQPPAQSLPAPAPQAPALFTREQILAYAEGSPSECFGEPYQCFDNERVLARLPRPPFMFLDRITEIEHQPWEMKAGGRIAGQYDIPPDVWYFAAERGQTMPFVILLEIALQPCGWFAAYMGSALTSKTDLKFRNLGGKAVLHRALTPQSGTLTMEVVCTNVSSSGGMIIQNYDMRVSDAQGLVYEGDTYFGFFSKAALANQIGIRDAERYQPSAEARGTGERFPYPTQAPYPDDTLRMIDEVTCFLPEGGPNGLGFIEGTSTVKPEAWFFDAHFYQDPVIPGSLGLESFIQLLKVAAVRRWGEASYFDAVANGPDQVGHKHQWIYRGQVIPSDKLVTVQAVITVVDDQQQRLTADGFLTVDGRIIYQMKDFTLTCK